MLRILASAALVLITGAALAQNYNARSVEAALKALGDANQDLVYTPVTPCRLFDTRASQGGLGTPTLNVRRTYGAISPVTSQGGPGACAAGAGAAVALIQIGTIAPSGSGILQGGSQGAASFPNALILYQPGDQYGTAVAMPLNSANGRFDLMEQFATADLYGDLVGYFKPATFGVGNLMTGQYATVSGGSSNAGSGIYATVGGGYINTASGPSATVGGGNYNYAFGDSSTVAGGSYNSAVVASSTVGGGLYNTAGGQYSTVGGGTYNNASGLSSTVAGGSYNAASGTGSTVGGGQSSIASGSYSFAAGYMAKTQTPGLSPNIHNGVFIFSDSNIFEFNSVAANEFAVRSTGGARFVTAIDSFGMPTLGVSLSAGGGAWASLSDRAAKQDLEPVDAKSVLARLAAMPIYSWRYRTEVSGALHLGPTAQDFRAAFGLGDSDKTITTIDEGGIALAAIQGLHERMLEGDAKIDAQATEIVALKVQLAELMAEQSHASTIQKGEIAELRRSVEVLLARNSPEGKLATAQ